MIFIKIGIVCLMLWNIYLQKLAKSKGDSTEVLMLGQYWVGLVVLLVGAFLRGR